MAPQDRLSQISSHLANPCGLLSGQVAIITGGGQGIGAATARLFAAEGAKVLVADVDQAKAAAVAHEINTSAAAAEGQGPRASFAAGDVLDEAYLKNVIKAAVELGGGKIHIVVNNAGFTWDGVIHKMSDKQWSTILDVHVKAPFKLVQLAAPYFRVKDGEPRAIVNISSASGLHGNAGQANYAVAKAGITGLTKTIAKEWGPAFGVRANTVAFGHILTRLTAAKELGASVTTPSGDTIALGIPAKQLAAREGKSGGGQSQQQGGSGGEGYPDIPLRRPGTADEAARAILAVASPLFGYVTGQTISVTGGRNM